MFNVKHGSKSEAKVRKNRAAFLSSQNQILSGSGSLPGVPDASALRTCHLSLFGIEKLQQRRQENSSLLSPLSPFLPFAFLGPVKNETRL